ncbi:Hypothetical protein PHPALM_37254 [Phytophthora palmivora]|uniref:PiggyBac transposable element-derived protein domain-containing protein n=1 Tax=Phytophthora palmivora TaxID=4796 RepID=A0A2P4WXX0_9STRA|nr:Hypothetical protein PHPALM_37254 [Phytophthora palmivora]
MFRATTDRAWKLRPVIDALQIAFHRNFIPLPVMTFDEGLLPSTSPFNRMRTGMKAKPHRWGPNPLCCAAPSPRSVFGILRKASNHDDSTLPDTISGPAAMVRNLRQVFGQTCLSYFRLIRTDRFYTSVVLSMQLLAMNFYSVGTVMTTKKGRV